MKKAIATIIVAMLSLAISLILNAALMGLWIEFVDIKHPGICYIAGTIIWFGFFMWLWFWAAEDE